MKTFIRVVLFAALFILSAAAALPHQVATTLQLNDQEYFKMPGLNVMTFQDIYLEGHQAGVSIILNGVRLATNRDILLDPTPGQWQPTPKQDSCMVEKAKGEMITTLSYPVYAIARPPL